MLCSEMRVDGTMADGCASVKLAEVTGFDQADDVSIYHLLTGSVAEPSSLQPYKIVSAAPSPVLDAIHTPFQVVLLLLSLSHLPDEPLRPPRITSVSLFCCSALVDILL